RLGTRRGGHSGIRRRGLRGRGVGRREAGCRTVRCRRAGGGTRPAVLHLDLGAAHRVLHRLRALSGILADHHFLAHPRLLADHRLLGARGDLDRALAERIVGLGYWPVDRAAIHADVFLVQSDLLLDRTLDDIAAHPHAAAAHFTLADAQPLLGERDALLAGFWPRAGRC